MENVLKTDLSVTLNYDVMMVMMNSIAVSLFFQNIMIIMRIHIESIKSDQNNFFQNLSLILCFYLFLSNLFSECEMNEFPCNNGVCISQEKVCDRIDDCGDFSDEKFCGKG